MAYSNVSGTDLIHILRAHDVGVSSQAGGPSNMFVLTKGDFVEAREIPDEIGRMLIHYLSRKFGIPIHRFYGRQTEKCFPEI